MTDQSAVLIGSYGTPDVLRVARIPVPDPLPTEVRIRVHASGVNPVDAKTRAGVGMASVVGPPPFVPGWDIAGVVDAVGLGVTRFQPGDEVMGMLHFPREAGGYAQYATAPSRQLALIPSGMTYIQAGGLPMAGLTAWHALVDIAKIEAGNRVVVLGAGGGVGHLAVQIASECGAHVIAVASGRKRRFLEGLGVDVFVDYLAPNGVADIHGADVVLDLVGGLTTALGLQMLRPDGLLITAPSGVTAESQSLAKDLGVNLVWFLVEPDGRGLEQIAELFTGGGLRLHIDSVVGMRDAATAHRAIESGHTLGKIVLVPE